MSQIYKRASASSIGAFTSITRQVFTTDGDYTPTPGMVNAIVETLGGGGGGGGAASSVGASAGVGGGGGSGGYSSEIFTAAEIGSGQLVTVGLGGIGGDGDVTGANGGITTFGILLSGDGGLGGESKTGITLLVAPGGSGGVGAGGDFNTDGSPGNNGLLFNSTLLSGSGGASFFGGNASGIISTFAATVPIPGNSARTYGAGGSGAAAGAGATSTDVPGGDGFDGICIITEYIS